MFKIIILIIIAIIFSPMFLPFILFLFTKDEKEEFQCKLLEEKRREDRWKIWKRKYYKNLLKVLNEMKYLRGVNKIC